MEHDFDSVLDNDLVEVVERDNAKGYFCIRIGTLDTPVMIHLGRYMTTDETKYFVSHAIKTPLQGSPYRTSQAFDDTPAGALRKAVFGLTNYYRRAVGEGHEPNEDWLVKY